MQPRLSAAVLAAPPSEQEPEMSAHVLAAWEMSSVPISLSILRHIPFAVLSALHGQECGSFWKASTWRDNCALTEDQACTMNAPMGLGCPAQSHQQHHVSVSTSTQQVSKVSQAQLSRQSSGCEKDLGLYNSHSSHLFPVLMHLAVLQLYPVAHILPTCPTSVSFQSLLHTP